MKNIKEAEELTGISRQNIRYYEKMGLLNPKRDAATVIANMMRKILGG